MNVYRVEYEIPPMRSIQSAYFEGVSEEAVREYVADSNPAWKIRKVERENEAGE